MKCIGACTNQWSMEYIWLYKPPPQMPSGMDFILWIFDSFSGLSEFDYSALSYSLYVALDC